MLVVGGGLAGLRAAIAAAEAGADVVLADEGPEPGGRALAEGAHDRARELTEQARGAGVEILASASALGCFDGLVAVWQAATLHQVRARRLVFATGVIEQPLVFAGNDLPGVMLSGGALRLASLYAVAPGTRAVVATTSDRGLDAALALQAAGVQVVAVADLRTTPGAAAAELQRTGAEVLAGWTALEAEGRKAVQAVTLGALSDHNGSGPRERRVECDLLVMSGGVAPATSLIAQAGGRTTYDDARGHFAIAELPDGVDRGRRGRRGRRRTPSPRAERAGAQAAHALGLAEAPASDGAPERHAPEAVPPAVAGAERGKCFACLCEDVTAKDIHLSVEEGYDSIELSKRYTTATMGPCQGRMCQLPAVRLMAQETGQDLQGIGTTTARPPWSAVPLGALAGRPFEPAKRSAIHPRHRALGAQVKWAGDWRRAYDYGDPQAEALAVHEAAGLIDVSTLGKLIVRGPEAGAFLDRLYPNRFANLKPGRIRYGVLTSDAGRITDDGTICRLDDESFYVTTTSSGAGAVEQWFSWWQADWRMQVHLTDVTQGLAAVNLAGPRAREIMGAPDRPRLLQRGLRLPRRQARAGRGRARAHPAHRLRRRGRLRDPLPLGLRPARVGRDPRGRRRARDPALRPRAPAHPAPAEAAHHRRPGHRLGVHALRRRDAVDRQARQGRGLHRQVGARARGRERRRRRLARARRLHPARRRRAHRGRRGARRPRRARRPGHERAPLAPARPRHRHGLGSRRAGERRRVDHDLRRPAHAARRAS